MATKVSKVDCDHQCCQGWVWLPVLPRLVLAARAARNGCGHHCCQVCCDHHCRQSYLWPLELPEMVEANSVA